MTMSTLMCPHCGGQLLIDPTQQLQSMLSCPYCGCKSLMLKTDGQINLRGIISPSVEKLLAEDDLSAPSSSAAVVDASPATCAAAAAPPIDEEAVKERLILLAANAANTHQMAIFNCYSRQAIDCDPTDPRMYALRARLIEEAHGFARATFLSPGWLAQTPRQKSWIIAQHFSSLNAAVTYSPASAYESLASKTGTLIAWQIRETFVEQASLRLGKRPFTGKFHRNDLLQFKQIIDACLSINEHVVPQISSGLLLAIRVELSRIDPWLADRMKRIGF